MEKLYTEHCKTRDKLISRGLGEGEINKRGFYDLTFDEYKSKFRNKFRKELVDVNEVLKKVGNPPSELKYAPQKQIRISFKNGEGIDLNWPSLCFVYLDDDESVKEVFFNEDGVNKLFNASDLSTEEIVRMLVDNYDGIPSMSSDVQVETTERGLIKSNSWVYKSPKGYQVDVFEREVFDSNGRKYSRKMLDQDTLWALNLKWSLNGKYPKRYLDFKAITKESERKFD